MLYLHQGLGDFEKIVFLFRSGSFGFRLTSLAAIFLYPLRVTNDLPQKLHFLVVFMLLYRLLVHSFNRVSLKW